jgi:hypothetical protein
MMKDIPFKALLTSSILFFNIFSSIDSIDNNNRPITIAILAKDKAYCLPFYLSCLEEQTWPSSHTYLYIRTNNNNDSTAKILKEWVAKVKDRYLEIYFDETDIPENIQQYAQHEWNCTRLKVLGNIRNKSLEWAQERGSHYFVADCDNFIVPHTIESMLKSNVPIVAPLLRSNCTYSNYHADIDKNGYYRDSPNYLPLLYQQIKDLFPVPVVHCTYFIRHEVLHELTYDDDSYRYEYVIFSDTARKKNITQYLDTREVYGYLTFVDSFEALKAEPWFNSFYSTLESLKKSK